MPGIEVSAHDHHLVLLVRPGNFRDGVVRGSSLGISAIDDVELEFDRRAVAENSCDSSVVLVSYDDRRDGLGDVKGSVVERDDLPVFPAGIVHADDRAVINKKLIDPGLELPGRDCARPWSLLAPSASPALACTGVAGIVPGLHVFIGVSLCGGREVHGYKPRRTD